MWEDIGAALIAQGPLGITCVVLGIVVWRLYTDNKAKDAEIKALSQARVDDANKVVDRVVSITQSLDRNTEAMKDAIEATQRIRR